VFSPTWDGRYEPVKGRPGDLVIVDGATWPGRPVASWPPAVPGVPLEPPRGGGTARLVNSGTPIARCPVCERSVKWLASGALVAHMVRDERCPGKRGLPAEDPAVAAWLPVRHGLSPRGAIAALGGAGPGQVAGIPQEIGAGRRAKPGLPNSSHWHAGCRCASGVGLADKRLTWTFFGGRYWDRTSDLFGVNEALSR
jgi:hypothetical protein